MKSSDLQKLAKKNRSPDEEKIFQGFIAEQVIKLKQKEAKENRDFSKMEKVTPDENGTEWRYDAEVYYRTRDGKFNPAVVDGRVPGRIKGEYIPDPVKLWEQKCKVAGVQMGTEEANKYRPSKAVFDLWEHWNS